MKRLLPFFLLMVFLFVMLVVFRNPILVKVGSFLIHEDNVEKVDAMVVLSGSAFERGGKGASLWGQGVANKILCPGGNLVLDLLILTGDTIYENNLTRLKLIQEGVPDSLIFCVNEGTSTIEEANAILRYCQAKNVKSIMIVSSYFHTARAYRVYKKVFEGSGISINMQGSPAIRYDEKKWWTSEDGLINFNNELVKSIYYFVKY